jgi:phage baseplate assembly protein W
MAPIYRGFSFKNWQRNKSFVLTDVELVKQDLLNHFFTTKGERVGMRGYGTTIQNMLFDPFTPDVVVAVSDQVREVIASDPRVELVSEDDFITEADYDVGTLNISVLLYFVELDLKGRLDINLVFEG